jgi:competence protein ComFC
MQARSPPLVYGNYKTTNAATPPAQALGDTDDKAMLLPGLKSWVDTGLAFFYPEWCQLCSKGRATASEGFVCSACRSEAKFIEPPFCDRCGRPYEGAITTVFECTNCRDAELHFRSARSAVLARTKVLDVIHRYKYNRARWFEPYLAELLIQRAEPELRTQKWDLIVPVPLHPVKHREREFNQAERLGRRLAAALDIDIKNLLKRTVLTPSQTLLSRKERLENVRNAFAFNDRVRLSGERIVLIDDVFTTGATTSACAQVLMGAGAGEVCVWTVARGI